MSKPADRLYFLSNSIATFSPNGEKFVLVLRKGNLMHNTNEFSVFMGKTKPSLFGAPPEHLFSMYSSSNRLAVREITWLDNDVIAFLGEKPNQSQQLWTFNLINRVLSQVTSHSSNLISYSVSPSRKDMAYVAEQPPAHFFDSRALRDGVVVSSQLLSDLIADRKGGESWDSTQLLFVRHGHKKDQRLDLGGQIPSWQPKPFLSPDGRYVVIAEQVPAHDIPLDWKEYTDAHFLEWTDPAKIGREMFSWFVRFDVIKISTGQRRVLLNAPLGAYASEANVVTWMPDSKSVVIASTYVPLENSSGEERKLRRSLMFAVEVSPETSKWHQIDHGPLTLFGRVKKCIRFSTTGDSKGKDPITTRLICKSGSDWNTAVDESHELSNPQVLIDEDLNSPPKIAIVAPNSKHRIVLLDLNPQFHELRFGRVEEIRWKGLHGDPVDGALFYPVDYRAGERYPLVIQTHGFIPKRFIIDGIFSTANAAQPLAGRGMMVLQADESLADMGTTTELQRELAGIDGAIDYLDGRGLVDVNRLGIVGFSRTCLHVSYALSHSKYHFAAASLTDGLDGGDFQYTAFSNSDIAAAWTTEKIIGATPFGPGMTTWINRSPLSSLNTVRTPLLLLAQNGTALLNEWEWFAGLNRLNRPVELIYLKDGSHLLEKPWHRMVSLQSNVDWFSFWLKNDETKDPAKSEQYLRWRHLRDQKIAQEGRMQGIQ
jgi:hypothetical protein